MYKIWNQREMQEVTISVLHFGFKLTTSVFIRYIDSPTK